MAELTPKTVTPIKTPEPISSRNMNLSGTPLPDDLRRIIKGHFDIKDDNEALDIVYQYVLHKSPTAEIDDIKTTLLSLADKLAPDKNELFYKIKDMAINELSLSNPKKHIDMKKEIIKKEMPGLERQAQNTGDWRFYLRASRKLEELDEVSDTE